MVYGFDDIQATSIGTGTTETLLNAGAALRVPSTARGIVELIMYQGSSAAYTADQTISTGIRPQSDDVGLEPKRFMMPNINTGDSAFVAVLAPRLKDTPMNVSMEGFERINYNGFDRQANAAEIVVGGSVVITD